jgi:hypothetical protein
MNRHNACRPRLVNIHDLHSTTPNPTHEESQWNNLLSAEDKKHLQAAEMDAEATSHGGQGSPVVHLSVYRQRASPLLWDTEQCKQSYA